MENYIHSILQNLADQKDITGSGIYGTGRRRKAAKRRVRRGKGLIGGMDEIMESLADNEGEGEGIYGTGRRRRKPRKMAFNIGKYSKAISQGKTKTEAKIIARR